MIPRNNSRSQTTKLKTGRGVTAARSAALICCLYDPYQTGRIRIAKLFTIARYSVLPLNPLKVQQCTSKRANDDFFTSGERVDSRPLEYSCKDLADGIMKYPAKGRACSRD